MTSSGTIDYERLAQTAMRGVIREILKQTEQSGLPGEHHFYVQFETNAPGVNISKRLRERYPDEMTIVLQHRFWDLAVHDDYFEVKLTFDSIPERLVVPFAAIKVFFDPSVRYALQFENLDMAEAMERDAEEMADSDDMPFGGPRGLAPVEPSPVAKLERPTQGSVPALVALHSEDGNDSASATDSEIDAFTAPDAIDDLPGEEPAGEDASETDREPDAPDAADTAAKESDQDEPEDTDSGVVVSLDAFRKK
jgi:hypothetical protein